MKNRTPQLLTAVVYCFVCGSLLRAESTDDLKSKMASSDVQVRTSALNAFCDKLGRPETQNQVGAAIPVLVGSIADADPQVRGTALWGLLKISLFTPSNPTDSTSVIAAYPPAQKAILTATSDSNILVRQLALQVYAANYKLTPDVENKIIAEINAPEPKSQGGPTTHATLIESLMIGRSPSPHATEFLTSMLDDPKYGSYVAERMGVDHCPLSGGALNKLADKLSQEKDSTKRANYARAIGSYGKQAQQYAPQLRAALANEKDEVAKQNLQAALAQTQ